MAVTEEDRARAADLLRPILDLMTGVDGAVGYAKLHHSLLPQIVAMVRESKGSTGRADWVLRTVQDFSAICSKILEEEA